MIKIGDTIRLHKGSLYQICDIHFKITEEGGAWACMVVLMDLATNKKEESLTTTIECLLNSGDFYLPGDEDIYTKLHQIRETKALC